MAACEPRRGRGHDPGNDVAGLRRECDRLRRECARQQALVRAAERTIGLGGVPPEPPVTEEGRKRRKRRPTARALKMAAMLQAEDGEDSGELPVSTEEPRKEIGLETERQTQGE